MPMKTVSLSEAKDKLSALIDEVENTHEIIQVTRHGHAAAVIMAADDLESLHETLHWLTRPGIRDDLEKARADIADGTTVSGQELRARYGLPPQ
jgi:antitoxin YefM